MSLVFIITLVLLAAIAYTIYRKQRRSDYAQAYELPPPPRQALFGEGGAHEDAPHEPSSLAEGAAASARIDVAVSGAGALLERAARGDAGALAEARQAGGDALYRDVLGALVSHAGDSRERLDEIAEVVCADERPRGSAELSQSYSRAWEQSPDASSTARALHLAALSDDAEEFSRVLDGIVRLWREGKLPALSAEDLRALAESQFWVLSAPARASGAAFVLKQKIAALRDEPAARV